MKINIKSIRSRYENHAYYDARQSRDFYVDVIRDIFELADALEKSEEECNMLKEKLEKQNKQYPLEYDYEEEKQTFMKELAEGKFS